MKRAQPSSHPQRILILGGEASGKTSLGRRLGASLGLPPINLDTVAWQSAVDPARSLEGVFEPDVQSRETLVQRGLTDRASMVQAIADEPSWVVEGVFLGWTQPLFERADRIVWLDHVALTTTLRRVAGRHLRTLSLELRARRSHRPWADVRLLLRTGRSFLAVTRRVLRYRFWDASRTDPEAYGTITRAAVAAALAPHASKATRITSAEALRAWIAELGGTDHVQDR